MWPTEVPILSADDIYGHPHSKPIGVWIIDIFERPEQELVIGLFAQVHNRTLQHTSPALSSRSNERRASLFNITMSLLGYTEGQSEYIRIQSERIEDQYASYQLLSRHHTTRTRIK